MRRVTTKIASIAAAAAIILAPTAASASALPSSSAPSNAWVTLSQLNPAGATALAGSAAAPSSVELAGAAAAVQPADDTYRPNPLPLPVIAVLLAVLGTMIYIAFIEKHHQSSRPFLTSPQ